MKKRSVFILILILILLISTPMLLMSTKEFKGTDDTATELIVETTPNYKPWISPILKQDSKKFENLLFALQSAIGAGVIGYGIGYMRGVNKKEIKNEGSSKADEKKT